MNALKKSLIRYGILLACVLTIAFGFVLFPHTHAHADQRSHGSPVGTWSVVTTFTSGSRNGQQETSTIIFNEDGTLTETSGSLTGTGTWTQNDKYDVVYTIQEAVGRGEVEATDDATLVPNGKTYSASGSGAFYINNNPIPGTSNTSTSSATLINY